MTGRSQNRELAKLKDSLISGKGDTAPSVVESPPRRRSERSAEQHRKVESKVTANKRSRSISHEVDDSVERDHVTVKPGSNTTVPDESPQNPRFSVFSYYDANGEKLWWCSYDPRGRESERLIGFSTAQAAAEAMKRIELEHETSSSDPIKEHHVQQEKLRFPKRRSILAESPPVAPGDSMIS